MLKNRVIVIFIALCLSGNALSQPDSTKLSYHLFHPTPMNMMRSFETDRPDATESPYTVDAGHFQVETDLFKSAYLSMGEIRTIENQYNAFNLKAGISNTLDLQFVLESIVTEKIIETGSTNLKSGIGNITIRAKQNVWGDDRGKTAFAILPFINIPTSSGTKITGGLILPFSLSLSANWSLGTQVEFDLDKNQSGFGYHMNLLASVTASHPLYRNFSFFAENLISRETELKSYEYYINTGLVFNCNDKIKFDAGVNYGLTRTSSKIYFIGFSYRH